MKTRQISFGIHRFGDSVALHTTSEPEHVVTMHGERVPSCPTIYLSPEMAREIAAKLVEFADDIEQVKFSQSTL